MPRYLLHFTLETCLAYEQDLQFDFRGHQPTLLFSKKTPKDKYLIAQIGMDAPNNQEAWGTAASSLLPPILDALSFATGTPLLLRDCELVLKGEAGNNKRRALYVGHQHVPSLAQLRALEIEETKKILETGENLRLPLCWHRYELDKAHFGIPTRFASVIRRPVIDVVDQRPPGLWNILSNVRSVFTLLHAQPNFQCTLHNVFVTL